jgi:integrase/recombinase XerD
MPRVSLETAARRVDDIPDNIFGQKREHLAAVRQRYEVLFGLLLNSGLRITEALNLKVRDRVDRSLRVIDKGNRERWVPLWRGNYTLAQVG